MNSGVVWSTGKVPADWKEDIILSMASVVILSVVLPANIIVISTWFCGLLPVDVCISCHSCHFELATTIGTSISKSANKYWYYCHLRPRYLYRCWCFNEVTRDEDRFWLLRRIATAAARPPVCFQIRVPVTSSITRSVTAGPWQCHSFWNPAVFAKAAPVGDEFGCPTGFLRRGTTTSLWSSVQCTGSRLRSELTSSLLSLYTSAYMEQHPRTLLMNSACRWTSANDVAFVQRHLHHWSSVVCICQPSATELFLSLPPMCGMVCRST